jgi:hypothetical protein
MDFEHRDFQFAHTYFLITQTWPNRGSAKPSGLYHRIAAPLASSAMAINHAQFRRMP